MTKTILINFFIAILSTLLTLLIVEYGFQTIHHSFPGVNFKDFIVTFSNNFPFLIGLYAVIYCLFFTFVFLIVPIEGSILSHLLIWGLLFLGVVILPTLHVYYEDQSVATKDATAILTLLYIYALIASLTAAYYAYRLNDFRKKEKEKASI